MSFSDAELEAVYDAIAARVRAGQQAISNREIAGIASVSVRVAQAAIHSLLENDRVNRWKPAGAGQYTPYSYGLIGEEAKVVVPPRPARMTAQDRLDARIRAANAEHDERIALEEKYRRIVEHNPPTTMNIEGAVANAYALAREKGVEVTVTHPMAMFAGVLRRAKPRHFPQCECGLAFNPRAGETRCIICIEGDIEAPTPCAQCGNGFYPAHASVLLCSECAYA